MAAVASTAPTLYNANSLGPSAGAGLDQAVQTNKLTDANNAANMGKTQQRGINDYNTFTLPQLQSSMGAAGQLGSSAASLAQTQAHTNVVNANADLQSQFDQAHNDMLRQQAWAAAGIIL
jgi:hypothetical protein